MRIKGQIIETMRAAMWAVVEHLGGAEEVKAVYAEAGHSTGQMLWDIWWQATHSLFYDDTHPAFVKGQWTRVVPCNPVFRTAVDEYNDARIETALKAIGRELGIV